MKHAALIFQTLLAAAALLAACVDVPATEEPALETPTPSPPPSETPVWFPATLTPSPFPSPVVNPTEDLRAGIGELLLEDDFSESQAWSTSMDGDAMASVSNGRLNLVLKETRSYLITTRSLPSLADFYVEITASPNFCHGEDEYGLVLRAAGGNHFRFALSCDGRAKVDRYYGGSLSRQAGWLASGAIPALAPSSSKLAVWARGGQLHFFVNDFYLFSVTDSQLFQGTLGAFVRTSGERDMSVSFLDLKVWQVEK